MRIFLGGRGLPIPPIALPDPNVADAAVPAIIIPEDGETFVAADYIPLGYTHYEVWCVGGVGGRGADAALSILWDRVSHQEYAPDAEWNKVLASYEDTARGSNTTSYSGTVPVGTPMPPEGVCYWQVNSWGINYIVSPRGLAYLMNPGRMMTVFDYSNPHPGVSVPSPVAGGGGGGGGLQVVSGRLDELPTSVPIVVGEAGLDAVPGQAVVNAPYDPVPPGIDPDPYYRQFYQSPGTNPREGFYNRYPSPHPLFGPPGVGGDGGYSAFGDLCAASGGKGGGPAVVWEVDGKPYFSANGGEGGKGGRTDAGGGAAGAINTWATVNAKGKDGVWDPSTRIGEGGGGGHGGMAGIYTVPIGQV